MLFFIEQYQDTISLKLESKEHYEEESLGTGVGHHGRTNGTP